LAIGRRSRFADEEPWTGAVIEFRNGSNDGGSIDGGSEEAMGSCLIIHDVFMSEFSIRVTGQLKPYIRWRCLRYFVKYGIVESASYGYESSKSSI